MRDGESMLWPVVAMLLGAALIVSLCMHPGLSWNWNAVGAIGSAMAAIGAVGNTMWNTSERRREKRAALRSYAVGVRAIIPGIAKEMRSIHKKGESAAYLGGRPRYETLCAQLDAINIGDLAEFDGKVGEDVSKAVENARQIRVVMAQMMPWQVGFSKSIDLLSLAANNLSSAVKRLDEILEG